MYSRGEGGSGSNWQAAERRWISFYRADGARLVAAVRFDGETPANVAVTAQNEFGEGIVVVQILVNNAVIKAAKSEGGYSIASVAMQVD
jgi:hypothetical protein